MVLGISEKILCIAVHRACDDHRDLCSVHCKSVYLRSYRGRCDPGRGTGPAAAIDPDPAFGDTGAGRPAFRPSGDLRELFSGRSLRYARQVFPPPAAGGSELF